VLSGGGDKTLRLWDVATGKEVRSFSGHREWITSVAFSPDGRLALSGSGDNTRNMLKLWNVATGEQIGNFNRA
jgi:WD40 repeat protein